MKPLQHTAVPSTSPYRRYCASWLQTRTSALRVHIAGAPRELGLGSHAKRFTPLSKLVSAQRVAQHQSAPTTAVPVHANTLLA